MRVGKVTAQASTAPAAPSRQRGSSPRAKPASLRGAVAASSLGDPVREEEPREISSRGKSPKAGRSRHLPGVGRPGLAHLPAPELMPTHRSPLSPAPPTPGLGGTIGVWCVLGRLAGKIWEGDFQRLPPRYLRGCEITSRPCAFRERNQEQTQTSCLVTLPP